MFPERRSGIVSSNEAVFFNVDKFVIGRSVQHDRSLHIIQHVVENRDTDADLLALHADVWHFHINKEGQHTDILQKCLY